MARLQHLFLLLALFSRETLMQRFLSALALLLLVSALASTVCAQDPNLLTAEEKQAGWRLLFDGKTNSWRGPNDDSACELAR